MQTTFALISLALLSGCAMFTPVPREVLAEKDLPGVWSSHYARMTISCGGGYMFSGKEHTEFFEYDRTETGSMIAEIHPNEFIVGPIVKSTHSVKEWPKTVDGKTTAVIDDQIWTREKKLACADD